MEKPLRGSDAEAKAARRRQLWDWAWMGAVGGACTLVVAFAVQQVGAARDRQVLARMLLVEAEHNQRTWRDLSATAAPEPRAFQAQRTIYEATLPDHSLLPPDLVAMLYRLYLQSAKVSIEAESVAPARLPTVGDLLDNDLGITDPAELVAYEFGPGIAAQFESLPQPFQGRMLAELMKLRSQRTSALRTSAQSVDWDTLVERLQALAAPRWWTTWLD